MEAGTTNAVDVFDVIALIIDSFGMLATVAAVFVAIAANRKASKTLRYSLKMQEQTKNIELFDKRVAVIDEISKLSKTSVLNVELLFNKVIAREYGALQVYLNEENDAHHDMHVYEEKMSVLDGEDMYTSPIAELRNAEQILEELDYPEEKVKEFKALCLKYQITGSETCELKDAKVYNYEDLSEQIASTRMNVVKQKNKVIGMMKKFVKRSILPVDKKVSATK